MAFFSEELSLKAVCKNTKFGLLVMVDEWYWLIANAFYTSKLKKAKNKAEHLPEEQKKEAFEKIEEMASNHAKLRKIQIENRKFYTEI